jgi:hypothetical protein
MITWLMVLLDAASITATCTSGREYGDRKWSQLLEGIEKTGRFW